VSSFVLIALFRLATRQRLARGVAAVFLTSVVAALLFWAGGDYLSEKARTVGLVAESIDSVSRIDTIELSAVTILANRIVAEQNFLLNPLLGGGIGSHPVAYEKYSPFREEGIEGVNAQDASGLLLRLMSETGLLGTGILLFVLIYPIWKTVLLAKDRYNEPIAIVIYALCASYAGLLFGHLARYGAYFDLGLWFSFGLLLGLLGNNGQMQIQRYIQPSKALQD
jgi:hypothetical protein